MARKAVCAVKPGATCIFPECIGVGAIGTPLGMVCRECYEREVAREIRDWLAQPVVVTDRVGQRKPVGKRS